MAAIIKELKGSVQYRDRRFEGDDEAYYQALATSVTVYVGNLAFNTREEQLYEVFGKVGPIDRVIMGLNHQTRTPCGFAFVIYFSHKAAQAASSYITGTKLDHRYVRCDIDWGFQEGRQYGRGKTGGQVRDEFRQAFDAGRQAMNDSYSDGFGHGQVGRKRGHSQMQGQGRQAAAPGDGEAPVTPTPEPHNKRPRAAADEGMTEGTPPGDS